MEYKSSGIIKGIEVKDGAIASSYVINAVTGKRLEQRGYEFALSYFLGKRAWGRKARFDSGDMRVDAIDVNGLELSIERDGALWKVRIDYVSDGISGVLRKFIKVKCSKPDIIIDYIDFDGFDVSSDAFVWSIPKAGKRVFIHIGIAHF